MPISAVFWWLFHSLQGPWQQRTLPNPAYFKAEAPLSLLAPIVGIAFELWVTEPGYTFDNVLLGRGQQGLEAAAYMGKVGQARRLAQVSGQFSDTQHATGLVYMPKDVAQLHKIAITERHMYYIWLGKVEQRDVGCCLLR
jgi:hypothetical protein